MSPPLPEMKTFYSQTARDYHTVMRNQQPRHSQPAGKMSLKFYHAVTITNIYFLGELNTHITLRFATLFTNDTIEKNVYLVLEHDLNQNIDLFFSSCLL